MKTALGDHRELYSARTETDGFSSAIRYRERICQV